MEDVLRAIEESEEEEGIRTAFRNFNTKNVSNFKLAEVTSTIQDFCTVVMAHLRSAEWSSSTCSLALNSLRIVSRQHNGCSQLTGSEGVALIVLLAGLDVSDVGKMEEMLYSKDTDHINVLIEAIKCLCNMVMNNHQLARSMTEQGCLHGLKARLSLSSTSYHSRPLLQDVFFFGLRLLFLITACGPEERIKFREDYNSFPLLINLLDSVLFPPSVPEITLSLDNHVMENSSKVKDPGCLASGGNCASEPEHSEDKDGKLSTDPAKTQDEGTPSSQDTEIGNIGTVKSKNTEYSIRFPVRDTCFIFPVAIMEEKCVLVSEILKIIFNQTVHWKESTDYTDEELHLFVRLSHLLRILFCSIPLLTSKSTFDLFNHCCEVVMNLPDNCCQHFLIPNGNRISAAFNKLYPDYYQQQGNSALYKSECDYEQWNMAAAIALLNALSHRVSPDTDKGERHSLTVILGACSSLSKGCRVIRKFFRAEILPPLKEVKDRPELGDSLKSRVIRLMTARTRDCVDVAAEFLFILCKENATRLVKYTGYGNAAGLLMSRGLLRGGEFKGQDDYSSDSGCSDTEEYQRSELTLDPVTGGPSVAQVPSPLDFMSEDELEQEAEKLGGLLDKLNRQGIIKMVPVDKDKKPMNLPQVQASLDDDDTNSNSES